MIRDRFRRVGALPGFLAACRAVARGRRGGAEARARARRERLADLVARARRHSPVYAELYADLPDRVEDPALLPPVTKAFLMARLDRWIADPRIDRAAMEAFLARPGNLGRPFGPGGGLLCRTSGSSGVRGIVLHDRWALAVYAALWGIRGYLRWVGLRGLLGARLRGGSASVLAVTEHYAGAAWTRWAADTYGAGRRATLLPVSTPREELTRALERIDPAFLTGYSSALEALASSDARPRIRPALVVTSGEGAGPGAIEAIGAAFGGRVRSAYAASEFLALAFECDRGRLHVNDDFVILEPVDREGRPVPPGTASHTVWITNLVNRVQPILRYDLGDSVVVRAEPCGCGSDLPVVEVAGRRQDLLRFRAEDGSVVAVSGNPILEVIESVDGVASFQAIQTAPDRLRVRLAVAGQSDAEVWVDVRSRLEGFLRLEGLPGVVVERDPGPPRADPRSGKFHAVWSAIGAAEEPGPAEGDPPAASPPM